MKPILQKFSWAIMAQMKNALIILSLFLGTTTLSQDISLVADINTNPVIYFDLENLFAFQDRLYFSHLDNTFVYDGIAPPKLAFGIRPVGPYEYNQKLYFSSCDGLIKGKFWEYDGLHAPVEIAHFDFPYCSYPGHIIAFGNKLYFTLDDGVHGEELWVYDFANPPVMAADVYPGGEDSGPSGLITYDNKLYFIAGGRELWSYNGTNPPEKVMDLGWGLDHTTAVVNGRLCFTAEDSVYGRELWEYDGINPPVPVLDIQPGPGSSNPEDLYEMNQVLYFTATDSTHGRRFWKYDGIGSPVPADDLNENISGTVGGILKKINGKLYAMSSNQDTTGYELSLWVYDGINQPVQVVVTNQTSGLYWLTEAGGILYYVTHEAHSSAILWAWDGINPPMQATLGSTGSSRPNNLISFNHRLYFLADDGSHGFNVWGTDGANPPFMLTGADLPSLYWNARLIVMNQNLYLLTDSSVWVTDGVHPLTCLGTIDFYDLPFVFKDKLYYESWRNGKFELDCFDGINPPAYLANIPENGSAGWAEFDDKLYFSAWDPVLGTELFATNGNDPAGIVADVFPGPYGSSPSNLSVYRDKLYFSARDLMHGYALWVYDGVADPVMVADLGKGPDSSDPACLTQVDSLLYFESGGIIWEFDGTDQPGGVPGGYINPDFKPRKLTAFNHKLYFEGNDGDHGYEPWVYDGIHSPRMLADLNNNPISSMPFGYTGLRHTLFFASENPEGIWACDEQDTLKIVQDVNNDYQAFWPGNFFAFQNRLFFSAYYYFIGEELFALSLPPDTTVKIRSCSPYDFNGTWLTGSGTYYDTIPGSTGIDSIVGLTLAIKQVNTALIHDGQMLQAELSDGEYQWVNCQDNNSPVPGAVNRSFVPPETGEYAVIITDSGCVDTSACYAIQVTGLMESSFRKTISLYPNPNEGSFTIRLGRVCRDVVITLIGSDGQVIREENAGDTGAVDLKLEAPPGIYLVRITTENEVAYFKIIKE